MTKLEKRRTVTFYDYKNRPQEIPIPKESRWWSMRVGNKLGTHHCVVSCFNEAEVLYITPSKLARIAYCDSHAEGRILNTMLTGQLEQGIWCITQNGKLKAHWFYNRYFEYMNKFYPKQAKKLRQKIKEITK